MAQQLPENIRILRLFGASASAMLQLEADVNASGLAHAQRMAKGGETLLLLEALSGQHKKDGEILDDWTHRAAGVGAGALYASGDTTLAEAAVAKLRDKKRLFACADAATAALLEERLEALPGVDTVYDFGSQSYAHPKLGIKLDKAEAHAVRRFGEHTVGAMAARVQETYHLSGADYAAAYLPADTGESLLLVGDAKEYRLRLVSATDKPGLWLLDMLRRTAGDKPQAEGTVTLRYKDEPPTVDELRALLPAEAARAVAAYGVCRDSTAEAADRCPAASPQVEPDAGRAVRAEQTADTAAAFSAPASAASPSVASAPSAPAPAKWAPGQPDAAGVRKLFEPIPEAQTGKKQRRADDEEEEDNESTPGPARHGHGLLKALVLVLVLAAAAVAVLYWYTGGDLASLWGRSGLKQFNISNATLM